MRATIMRMSSAFVKGCQPCGFIRRPYCVDRRHILCGQKVQESRYAFPFFRNSKVLKITHRGETRKDVDYYWEKLADGKNKKARKCGWLKDKYGVSWQIVPTVLPKMISDPEDAAPLSVAPFVLICFFTAFAGSKWRPMTVRSR